MFTGCGTALVTPFRRDLSLDEDALRRLVRRQIEAGINFLVPCGTTGESPTLTRAEHLRVVEITLEEAKGKVPVLAGAGGYNTAEVIELAQELERMGVGRHPLGDAVLQQAHAGRPVPALQGDRRRAITLPIVVYSVQGRTGVNVEPATLARLAEIDNIVGVKEASGNIGADGQRAARGARSFRRALRRRRHHAPADRAGRARHDLGGRRTRFPREMTQLAQACLRGRFRRGARACSAGTCR